MRRNLRAEFNALRSEMSSTQERHLEMTDKEIIIHHGEERRVYVPNPTGIVFSNDRSFVRLIIWPYGSGKSTICLTSIVRHACAMPAWRNGRRVSRWLIIRNTSGELQSTTLQSWLQWFGSLGYVHKRQKPIFTLEHTFNDGNGIVELELIFLALDRDDDIAKLKSIEATGAYINEISEVPQAVLQHLVGRVNKRYPSPSFCPEPYWSGIIADTNPPDEDHWLYKTFEENPPPDYRVFHQPSGLLTNPDGTFIRDDLGNYVQNPTCDNHENISSDYYVKLAGRNSEGFIKVYCAGQYGLVETGKRVYNEYNDSLHSVDRLDAIQGLPIHLSWDFGLTPACVVFQISPNGQARVLKEYIADRMGIRTFARNVVLPSLVSDFPYNKIGESEADPAGLAGDAIMEELSCIGELNALGIKTSPSSTNDPLVRIGSVRYFLNQMVDGQPAFVLSRMHCPVLRKGFISAYKYKRMSIHGEERYHDKPDKNSASHPHDALQYGLMKFASDRIIEQKSAPKNNVDMYNPVMRIF